MSNDMEHGWYIAEPDGTTFGPMSRMELDAASRQRLHSAEALAWHVDISEWRLLSSFTHTPASQGVTTPPRAEPEAHARPAPAPVVQQPRTSDGDEAEREKVRAKARERRMRKEADKRAAASGGKPAAPAPAAATKPDTTHVVPVAFRRFAARLIDTLTLGLVGAAVLWAVLRYGSARLGPDNMLPEASMLALLLLAPIALAIIEIVALTFAATTPGKALLGLGVRNTQGARPNPVAVFRRSVGVLARGLAFGIPLIAPFAILIGGVSLINRGTTSWDERAGTRVVAEPLPAGRIQAAAIALVVLWFALTSSEAAQALRDLSNWVFGLLF